VVGRFLEHHRIYYFFADGAEDLYLSSADWMDRNLYRRVEVAFPILNPDIKQRVIQEGLKIFLKDNHSVWQMNSEGKYRRLSTRSAKAF
jgi:polyphosphate kinase